MDPSIMEVRLPARWIKLLRALMGLHPGRYQIVLSVWGKGLDYSIMHMGEVRIERD